MKYGKSELLRRLSDIPRKGWSENQVRDLIDSLWRNPELPTSGFRYAGGTDSEMGFDNGTRTFYIEPKTVLFGFYQKVTYLAYYKIYERQELQIEDTEGLHLIYLDSDTLTKKQVLMELVNPTDDQVREIYLYKVIVSWIYWPKPGTGSIYFGEERHGCEWNPQIHWWAHRVFNGVRETGLRLTSITYGDGSNDADAQFGVSAGSFHHEDMVHAIDAIISTGGLPVLYRYNNAGSLVPRFLNNYQFPVAPTLTDRIYYNDSSGELVPAPDNSYILCHVFATNCQLNQVIAVIGQAYYQTIREAFTACQDEIDQILTWMPHQTRLHISSVVYHTKNTYTNAPNARIIAEVTPEDLAEIVAEDVTPYTKTGWTPNIQKEAYFTEDAGNVKLILEADPGPAQHFVEGDRRTPEPLTNLALLAQTGMQYIRKYLDNFDISVTPFAGNEKNFAMVSALYWNNRQGYFCYTGWRMHPWEMEPGTRGNIIKKTGLELVSGLELSINEDVGLEHTVNITEGSIRLADITAEILDGGASLFKQQLTPLEARRYYLKTYSELSDPEDPESELVITHEWEYQHLIANNVAKLSAGNQVEINKLDDGAWILEETAENDYSAMWLVATLDHQYPLKWIVGSEKGTSLEEAKELNTPATLLAILNAAQLMDHYIVLARVIVKNITDAPYYELAEVDPYGDGEFDEETKDRHVIGTDFDEGTSELILKRNAGLPDLRQPIPSGTGTPGPAGADGLSAYEIWINEGNIGTEQDFLDSLKGDPGETGPAGPAGADGAPGAPGADGADGISTYTYVAYASDNAGTGFSLIPTDLLKYRAEIHVTSPLSPPISTDFTGATWVKYIGDDGDDGGGGGGTVPPELHLDFADAGLEFIYNVPYSLKFTSQVSEAGDATLSHPLDTVMARYTKFTVTSTAAGLVSLYGEYV